MKKAVAILLTTGLALGGVAFGVNAMGTDDTSSTSAPKQAVTFNKEQAVQPQKESPVKFSKEQANEIALQHVNGTIEKSELEKENGELVYEVDVQTKQGERDVMVNAQTGKAQVKVDDDNDDHDDDRDDDRQQPKKQQSVKVQPKKYTDDDDDDNDDRDDDRDDDDNDDRDDNRDDDDNDDQNNDD
jgi:uncharacterized membrane protein YkoI